MLKNLKQHLYNTRTNLERPRGLIILPRMHLKTRPSIVPVYDIGRNTPT